MGRITDWKFKKINQIKSSTFNKKIQFDFVIRILIIMMKLIKTCPNLPDNSKTDKKMPILIEHRLKMDQFNQAMITNIFLIE